MLPKKLRLPSPDILSVLKKGQRIFLNGIQVSFCRSKNSTPRLAIIVPNYVSKLSTVRNRNKRLIREAIRLSIDHIEGMDYVLMVKKDISETSIAEMLQIIRNVFSKIS